MKVTPVSGDMLVKVGLGVAVLGLGVYALYRIKNAATAAASAAAPYVNPADRRNLAYSGVNAVGSAITGQDFSLGAKIYDWLHPFENVTGTPTPFGGEISKPGVEHYDEQGNFTGVW